MSRPRKGGTLFGHSSDCYNWDNRCHCGSEQPFLLPPEEVMDTTDTHTRGSYTNCDTQARYTDYYNVPDPMLHRGDPATSRVHYGAGIQVPQGRETHLLGNGPQCFHMDNRCHCSSIQPYLIPPEGGPFNTVPQHKYGVPQYGMATNINTNTSATHQGSAARSHSHYGTGFGAGPHGQPRVWEQQQQPQQVTSRTAAPGIQSSGLCNNDQLGRRPGHNPYDDLPPSYSQLFPEKYNPS